MDIQYVQGTPLFTYINKNKKQYSYLTDNIVAWKNIDNADIVLSNGQDISNLAVKKNVEIQEQEEEIITSNKLDLCLILDCSSSMDEVVGNTTRMNKLKSATKNLIKGLGDDLQLRVTLIWFGEPRYDEKEDIENTFGGEWNTHGTLYVYMGRRELDLEQDMNKIFEKIDTLNVYGYCFNGMVQCYDSLSSYLKNSLNLLDYSNYSSIFKSDWPIYTRTYDTPPVIYGKNAIIKNCFVANGSQIDGEVENSIIGRGCIIEKGAVIKNSIILAYSKVCSNVKLNNVVVDKQAIIKYTKELEGTMENPIGIRQEDVA